MRFIVMHKVNDSMEAGEKPGPDVVERMGKLIGDGFAQGRVLDGAGLKSTSTRTRLTFRGGTCRETRGPLSGAHEPIAGVIMIKVQAPEEALSWTKRLAGAIGDVEFDVGPVTEPWDIGVMPKPEGTVPLRFLLTHKTGNGVEGESLTPAAQAKLDALLADMQQAGVLVSRTLFEPSAEGSRLSLKGGKRGVIDGPFSEAKELIAGYAILRADTKAEVIEWAWRYAEIIAPIELDVRVVSERS